MKKGVIIPGSFGIVLPILNIASPLRADVFVIVLPMILYTRNLVAVSRNYSLNLFLC